jgi:hypothetical protein
MGASGMPPLRRRRKYVRPSRRTSASSHFGEERDDGDTDAVQTAGELVRLFLELAAGMKDGQHDLERGLARHLGIGVFADGHAAAVVLNRDGIVVSES